MKKRIKYIIIAIIAVVIIAFATLTIVNIVNDKNKLTVEEKKWLNANLSTLQNINVLNDSPIYGYSGYGVFYDFLNDFSKEYQIKVNPITYKNSETNVPDGLKITTTLDDKSVVFNEDYYVLISKDNNHFKNVSSIVDNIGVLASDINYLKSYNENMNLVGYQSYTELENSFNEGDAIKYIMVPKTLYLNYLIKNNYNIVYHFSDIKIYYVLEMKDNDTFSIVLKKFFNNWKEKNLEKSYNKNLLNDLTSSLSLSEKDISSITAKVYKYGFVNNNPYEVLMGGNFGGIVSEYLEKFSKLTNVEFKFTKYKNNSQFVNALNNGEVDLYFNYHIINNDFKEVNTNMNVNYVVVAKNTNPLIINSLNSLQNKNVYVLENSIISSFLTSISNLKINTYKSIDDIKNIAKKDNIIVLDKETFEYLKTNDLKEYSVRYLVNSDSTYNFKLKEDNAFYKLFNAYVMIQDPEYIKISGIYNHEKTVRMGSIFSRIAMYVLIIIFAVIIILYLLYKSSKKVKISKKIRKEDKIKFIDQLTSLKNRNYLNQNIDAWNKNRIYPQSTIIIDLNKVQEINDTKGYDEGDKQIKAASNILIRTQLDNSDIMRTDGNEFLIYTIGYDKRAIETYIRKLIKEFKDLPYDYGAIITYALIEDDLKTIEDAINEAVDDMKDKKQEL